MRSKDEEAAQEVQGTSAVTLSKKKKKKCPLACPGINFAIISVITTIIAIWAIVISMSGVVVNKKYNTDQTGSRVGLLLVAVSSFITIILLVSGVIAIIKKKLNCINVVGGILVVLALFQAILAGTVVPINQRSEDLILKALNRSFLTSKSFDNSKDHKLWAHTQSEFHCCGVQGPNDYKDPGLPDFIEPRVPISCCPEYNKDIPEIAQEHVKKRCIMRRSYYRLGCSEPVVDFFKYSARVTLASLITLIILEIILAVLATVLYRRKDSKHLSSDPEGI